MMKKRKAKKEMTARTLAKTPKMNAILVRKQIEATKQQVSIPNSILTVKDFFVSFTIVVQQKKKKAGQRPAVVF